MMRKKSDDSNVDVNGCEGKNSQDAVTFLAREPCQYRRNRVWMLASAYDTHRFCRSEEKGGLNRFVRSTQSRSALRAVE